MSDLNDYARAARHYAADYGWSVVPMRPDSKRPCVRWKHLAYNDCVRHLEDWWSRWPRASVGVLTGQRSGGLVVLDIDDPDLAQETALKLPRTARGTTPSNGYHLYYVTGRRVKNGVRVAPGMDVRGDGGLVVAPPAPGRRWVLGPAYGVAELPSEWADALERRPREHKSKDRRDWARGVRDSRRVLDVAQDRVRDASEGERNDRLNRVTYKFIRPLVAADRLGYDEAAEAMTSAAVDAGLPWGEAWRTVESALDGL